MKLKLIISNLQAYSIANLLQREENQDHDNSVMLEQRSKWQNVNCTLLQIDILHKVKIKFR